MLCCVVLCCVVLCCGVVWCVVVYSRSEVRCGVSLLSVRPFSPFSPRSPFSPFFSFSPSVVFCCSSVHLLFICSSVHLFTISSSVHLFIICSPVHLCLCSSVPLLFFYSSVKVSTTQRDSSHTLSCVDSGQQLMRYIRVKLFSPTVKGAFHVLVSVAANCMQQRCYSNVTPPVLAHPSMELV